jgi:hypothetical protein
MLSVLQGIGISYHGLRLKTINHNSADLILNHVPVKHGPEDSGSRGENHSMDRILPVGAGLKDEPNKFIYCVMDIINLQMPIVFKINKEYFGSHGG